MKKNLRTSSLNPVTELTEVLATQTNGTPKIISEDTEKLLRLLLSVPSEYLSDKSREKMDDITTKLSNFIMEVLDRDIRTFKDITSNITTTNVTYNPNGSTLTNNRNRTISTDDEPTRYRTESISTDTRTGPIGNNTGPIDNRTDSTDTRSINPNNRPIYRFTGELILENLGQGHLKDTFEEFIQKKIFSGNLTKFIKTQKIKNDINVFFENFFLHKKLTKDNVFFCIKKIMTNTTIDIFFKKNFKTYFLDTIEKFIYSKLFEKTFQINTMDILETIISKNIYNILFYTYKLKTIEIHMDDFIKNYNFTNNEEESTEDEWFTVKDKKKQKHYEKNNGTDIDSGNELYYDIYNLKKKSKKPILNIKKDEDLLLKNVTFENFKKSKKNGNSLKNQWTGARNTSEENRNRLRKRKNSSIYSDIESDNYDSETNFLNKNKHFYKNFKQNKNAKNVKNSTLKKVNNENYKKEIKNDENEKSNSFEYPTKTQKNSNGKNFPRGNPSGCRSAEPELTGDKEEGTHEQEKTLDKEESWEGITDDVIDHSGSNDHSVKITPPGSIPSQRRPLFLIPTMLLDSYTKKENFETVYKILHEAVKKQCPRVASIIQVDKMNLVQFLSSPESNPTSRRFRIIKSYINNLHYFAEDIKNIENVDLSWINRLIRTAYELSIPYPKEWLATSKTPPKHYTNEKISEVLTSICDRCHRQSPGLAIAVRMLLQDTEKQLREIISKEEPQKAKSMVIETLRKLNQLETPEKILHADNNLRRKLREIIDRHKIEINNYNIVKNLYTADKPSPKKQQQIQEVKLDDSKFLKPITISDNETNLLKKIAQKQAHQTDLDAETEQSQFTAPSDNEESQIDDDSSVCSEKSEISILKTPKGKRLRGPKCAQ